MKVQKIRGPLSGSPSDKGCCILPFLSVWGVILALKFEDSFYNLGIKEIEPQVMVSLSRLRCSHSWNALAGFGAQAS